MKRIVKNKIGFTLIEMVLVIAIIVILAAITLISISGYINRARNAASSGSMHNFSVSKLTSIIDDQTYS